MPAFPCQYTKYTFPPPYQPYLQPFAAGPPQPTALGRAAAAGDLAVVTSDIFAAEAAAAGMTPDQYLAYQEDLVVQEVLTVRLLRCGQLLHFRQGTLGWRGLPRSCRPHRPVHLCMLCPEMVIVGVCVCVRARARVGATGHL